MNTKLLLAISICLNLVLGGAYWVQRGKQQGGAAPEVTTSPPARGARFVDRTVTNQLTQRYTEVENLDWRAVESEDYKKYIANLRAIGCPEETIRDIIVADVNKLFESRRKAASASTNKFEYWRTGNFFADMFDEKKVAEQQALTAEKKALLKELLGVDISDRADLAAAFNPFESLLDFLPADQQTRLLELEQKFAARMAKTIKAAQQGDPEAMRAVQAEKDAELLQILGPEQKLEYDLRMSQTAMMMRMQMSDFQPTEDEFRRLFSVRKEFDDKFSPMGGGNPSATEREQRRQAEKEMNNQFKAVLGDERYTEYKHDQDWARSSLKNVAKEHNIPKATAVKVFDIRSVAQEQAEQVRNNPDLSLDQKKETLSRIRVETESTVQGVLGAAAAKDYLDKGTWTKALEKVGSSDGSP